MRFVLLDGVLAPQYHLSDRAEERLAWSSVYMSKYATQRQLAQAIGKALPRVRYWTARRRRAAVRAAAAGRGVDGRGRTADRMAARLGALRDAAPLFAPAERAEWAGVLMALALLSGDPLLATVRAFCGAFGAAFYPNPLHVLSAPLATTQDLIYSYLYIPPAESDSDPILPALWSCTRCDSPTCIPPNGALVYRFSEADEPDHAGERRAETEPRSGSEGA